MPDENTATLEFDRRMEAAAVRAERSALRAAGIGDPAASANSPSAVSPVMTHASPSLPPLPHLGDPLSGSPGDLLMKALDLSLAELELVWSVVARAVDPRVSGHARVVFGGEARLGASLAQHIAWHELAPLPSRELLGVLNPRHVLQSSGLFVPGPYDEVLHPL